MHFKHMHTLKHTCHYLHTGLSGAVAFPNLPRDRRAPFTISATGGVMGDVITIERSFRIGTAHNHNYTPH